MTNIAQDATVPDRIGPRSQHWLIRLDRWLAGLGMMPAVLVLTAGGAGLATISASICWLIVFGHLPASIPVLTGSVGAVVGWPIILHSQKLIKALERKKRELTGLAVALAQSRDEAEASNRSKITFLANMSHELRTPLNAIIGFSELIRDEKNGPIGQGVYLDYAADINDSGRRLLDIINSVLDLSRIEAGDMEYAPEPVDLHQLIGECLRELRDDARRAALTIENNAATRADIIADQRLAKRVLFNTLSNAIKFNRAGGTVRVELMVAPQEATVTILDSGIGMTKDEIVTALRPFQQIDTSLGRRYGGTGLGLPLAKALVEHQGGTLLIDSEPGVGTTLAVTFPLASLPEPCPPRWALPLGPASR
ncbi:MAG TPA: ATP-binding protein [Aliidongia sp.]|nr:ATP-binding protein [Aliidongia sp.]